MKWQNAVQKSVEDRQEIISTQVEVTNKMVEHYRAGNPTIFF
jgi:hypothetical protein